LVEDVLRINGHWTFEVMGGQIKSPYGYPGDRLWVRETFVLERFDSEIGAPPLVSDRPTQYHPGDGFEWDSEYWLRPHYRATDPAPDLSYDEEDDPKCKWRPSIFMPRWASRITLEVVNVRVERLRDITEEDAKAEGVTPSIVGVDLDNLKYRASFQTLWNSINAKRGFGWDLNPYVWVIEFKKVSNEYIK
jgi:hypothetical protein